MKFSAFPVVALLVITAGAALGFGDEAVSAEGTLSVSGVVWEDLNMDGRRQEGEPGLAGVQVSLTGPGDLRRIDSTGPDGSYAMTGLASGTYLLTAGPAGFFHVMTYPARILEGEMEIALSLGAASVDTVDVGLVTVAATTRGGTLPVVSGHGWVDGRRTGQPQVAAFIDGVQCGFTRSLFVTPTEAGPGFYSMFFATADLVPGCGRKGATVTYMVDGRSAAQVTIYPPPDRFLTLTAGPRFAVYRGSLDTPPSRPPIAGGETGMMARVNGKEGCSERFFSFGGYELAVFSDELRSGCAREGDVVEFFRDGVKALETTVWTPGFHELNLTFGEGGIRPPDTGDGGLRELRAAPSTG